MDSTSMTLSEIQSAVLKQIEYYFSRENLANDAYLGNVKVILVSQMNSNLAVPIETIMSFGKIKSLTTDKDLVCEAVKGSELVVLETNPTMIRPTFKIQRNVVIIRNIPSVCEEAEVVDWCRSINLNEVVQVKAEIGDNWFVTFNSDSDALESLELIRGKKFRDKMVYARIKSDSLFKNAIDSKPLRLAEPQNTFAQPFTSSSGHLPSASAKPFVPSAFEEKKNRRFNERKKKSVELPNTVDNFPPLSNAPVFVAAKPEKSFSQIAAELSNLPDTNLIKEKPKKAEPALEKKNEKEKKMGQTVPQK